MLERHSRFPLDAENSMGNSQNIFESLPAREGPSSALFENSKNLASFSCELGSGNAVEHRKGVRPDPQSSSMPTPRCDQSLGTLNPLYHIGGTCSQNGVMDYPRYPISELHLGKFPDTLEFQSWKVNFKAEVCASSVLRQITMRWIARSMGSPRFNRRRTREGPEPACVQTPLHWRWHTLEGEGRINVLPWYCLVGVAWYLQLDARRVDRAARNGKWSPCGTGTTVLHLSGMRPGKRQGW